MEPTTQTIIDQMRILAAENAADPQLQKEYIIGFLAQSLAEAMHTDSRIQHRFWRRMHLLGLTRPVSQIGK